MRVLAWPGPSRFQNNPYTALVYGEFEKAGVAIAPYSMWTLRGSRAGIFHVHWPEAILWGRLARYAPITMELAAHRVLATMDAIRRSGGAVVWTAHNVSPHILSSPYHARVWDRFFSKFRRKVDALIGLTSRSLDLLCDAYPTFATATVSSYRIRTTAPYIRLSHRPRTRVPPSAWRRIVLCWP